MRSDMEQLGKLSCVMRCCGADGRYTTRQQVVFHVFQGGEEGLETRLELGAHGFAQPPT